LQSHTATINGVIDIKQRQGRVRVGFNARRQFGAVRPVEVSGPELRHLGRNLVFAQLYAIAQRPQDIPHAFSRCKIADFGNRRQFIGLTAHRIGAEHIDFMLGQGRTVGRGFQCVFSYLYARRMDAPAPGISQVVIFAFGFLDFDGIARTFLEHRKIALIHGHMERSCGVLRRLVEVHHHRREVFHAAMQDIDMIGDGPRHFLHIRRIDESGIGFDVLIPENHFHIDIAADHNIVGR